MSHSPFAPLLPLHGLSVCLKFTEPTEFNFFHQMTVDAFCRFMLNSPEDYKNSLTTEAPESGRLNYQMDDEYRFSVMSYAGKKHHFQPLINRLLGLPQSAPVTDKAVPIRNNCQCSSLIDLVDGKAVVNAQGLNGFTSRNLIDMARAWQKEDTCYPRSITLQWLSPTRLMRSSDDRKAFNLTGEDRFCRDKTHLTAALVVQRIIESLNNLITEMGQLPVVMDQQVYQSLPLSISHADLFWLDTPYYSKDKQDNTAGGMVGYITLTQTGPLPYGIWQGLILGQYLGIGQRRTSGFGKYQLKLDLGNERRSQAPLRTQRAQSLMAHALTEQRLAQAVAINDARADSTPITPKQHQQLASAKGQLLKGNYQPPPLFAQLIPKKDGSMRTLAVAPLFDRVLQKTISLMLTPCIDAILYHRSYAYRKGHSRQQARYDIQQAWNEGYRWVYESDIEDFFDAIDRNQLQQRLIALFGEDPIIPAVINWLAPDVILNGQRFERPRGIPQGSPLSPLMANFILDDFDADLESRGFRLIRFADDFIVLCKSRIEAELAADLVKNSLAELGLSINHEKSHIVSLEQGFKFLGYLFQNEWAVDIGGQKSDGRVTFGKEEAPNQLPAWLAALGEQEPINLEQQLADELGFAGQIDEQGTFLIVAGESSVLSLENGQIIVKRDEVISHSLPLAHLQGVLIFGNHHLTTPLIKAALKLQVPIHISDRMGNYEGAIWRRQPIDNSYKHWFIQLQHFDNADYALKLAKETVYSRLHNMGFVLNRYRKRPIINEIIRKLHSARHKIESCQNLSRLLGIEGSATREYFAALAELLPEWCAFHGRNRRPPKDPFNVLLSFGYTWLYAHADSMLISLGFLTWKGYYHQTSAGHAALSSDVIESYRHLVERTALTAVNNNMIKLDDFRYEDNQIRLSSQARRRYLLMLEKRFMKATNEKTPWQELTAQGKRLMDNIQHHAPYQPFIESP